MFAAAAWLSACATVPRGVPTCPTDAEVAEAARRYLAYEPMTSPPGGMTMEGAACGQAKLMAALTPALGQTVGYKAGLTNPAVQKRFGIDQPLLGVLLEKMVLHEGAAIPSRFGVRPFWEADLVVEVGSSAVNDATTAAEVLASLRAIYPFIELPDVTLEDPRRITAQSLTYYGVGARLGVLGTPLAVAGSAGLVDALRTMTVRTTDGTGKELATGPGRGPAPVHAATLLSRPGSVDALESMGASAPEPALDAYAVAGSEDHRMAVATVLSGLGVRGAATEPEMSRWKSAAGNATGQAGAGCSFRRSKANSSEPM